MKQLRIVLFSIGATAWSLPAICDRLTPIPLDAIVASSELIADVVLVHGRRGGDVGNSEPDECGYFYEASPNRIYKGASNQALRFYSTDRLMLGGRYLVFLPVKMDSSAGDLELSDASKAKVERFQTLRAERTSCGGLPSLSKSLPPRIMLIDAYAYIALGSQHVRIDLPSALAIPRSLDRVQVTLRFERVGTGDRPGSVALWEWLPYDALIRAISASAENDDDHRAQPRHAHGR